MKDFIFFILFCFSTSSAAFTAFTESDADTFSAIRGNYCQDDVHNYVAQYFGPEARVTKIFHVLGTGGMTHYVYFQINLCDGDFVASFRGDIWLCISKQRPRLQILNQVYTLSEPCRRLLPLNAFPNLYH